MIRPRGGARPHFGFLTHIPTRSRRLNYAPAWRGVVLVASVLVVDDDVAALALARAVLSEAGYVVTEAFNGRRGLQRAVASRPDVLIADILMPDGDGIELITAVKRAQPALRILAVSERRFLGELDLFKLANTLGADAQLIKPFEAESLLTAVARLLARPAT